MKREATSLSKADGKFIIGLESEKGGDSQVAARHLLLATGVMDIRPRIPNIHEGVQRGLIRYCPICDGYEARGKKVGVIGVENRGLGEAVFIARTYSRNVTLLSFHEPLVLSADELKTAKQHGISVIGEPIEALALDGPAIQPKPRL